MSKDVTLDRIDFEKLMKKAKLARAEYLQQHGAVANMVVGSRLRANHVAVVIAILLISFGVKMFFLSAPTAEADIHSVPVTTLEPLTMHYGTMPVQEMSDLTFVFPE